MIYKLHAIVLWSRRSRDADKIVGLFTDTHGRLTARATSAARSDAKFAALTEPFVECEAAMYLRPGQVWGKLVGGQLQRTFPGLRTELVRTTAAAWVCEIVHRLTPEEQPSPDKFALLLETLEALETATHPGLIRLAFALRFLGLAGFGLDNRDPWIALQNSHPDWAQDLMEVPLISLGEKRWDNPLLKELQHLAGSIVTDHISYPLHVNRFRQLTGVEI